MSLDLQESHPDIPTVPRVVSTREAVLMSLVAHLAFLVLVLLMPERFFPPKNAPIQQNVPIKFLQLLTPKRVTPPQKVAQPATVERPAASPVLPTKPPDPDPVPAKGLEPTTPPPPDTPPPPATVTPSTAAPTQSAALAPVKPGGGGLGDPFRDLGRYANGAGLDNQQSAQGNQLGQFDFDRKGIDFDPWLARFVAQVKHNWLVPVDWSLFHGHVVIHLNIYKSGKITDIQLIEGASFAPFNSAALSALRMSNPTIPLPTEYPTDPMPMTVIFYYNERIR
jgi:outer membrane biosynthesis protein TonB